MRMRKKNDPVVVITTRVGRSLLPLSLRFYGRIFNAFEAFGTAKVV